MFAAISQFFASDTVKKILAVVAIVMPAIIAQLPEHTVAAKVLGYAWSALVSLGLVSGGSSGLRSDSSRDARPPTA